MKQLLLLLAVAFSFTAAAQTDGSGARTPDTRGEDISTWSTAAKLPSQKERKIQSNGQSADVKSGRQATLTGCLAAGQENGKFMLATAANKRVAVRSEADVDLKSHVGHKVRLAGKWEKPEVVGSKKLAQRSATNRNFTAAKVDHIAAECQPPAVATSKGNE